MMKTIFVFSIGLLFGSVSVFLYIANLSAESEAQTQLVGILDETGTISIYLNNLEKEKIECFLINELERKIVIGNEISSFLKNKKFKLSSLSQNTVEAFEKSLEHTTTVEILSMKNGCKNK